MHEFNQSLKYDQRMYAADITGSIAYAKSLTLVGILTQDEETKITNGLRTVLKEWQQGTVSLPFRPTTFFFTHTSSSSTSPMTRTSTPQTRDD
jgi:argininosuccinate lyase